MTKIKDVMQSIGACKKGSRKAIQAGSLRRAYERASFSDLLYVLEELIPYWWEVDQDRKSKKATSYNNLKRRLDKIEVECYEQESRLPSYRTHSYARLMKTVEYRKLHAEAADRLRKVVPFEKAMVLYKEYLKRKGR